MTNAEAFDWAMQVAEAEQIAAAGVASGLTSGQGQLVENNALLHPGMVATLRRLKFDDAEIARAMLDPHALADAALEDAERHGG